jgi:hypothetical protein
VNGWSRYKADVPLFAVTTSYKCAWRAFYVSVRVKTEGWDEWHMRQVFHLGIDPTASRPSIFGSVQWHRRGISWRIPVKLVNYRMTLRWPCLQRLYAWQTHLLHSLDGRRV